MANHLAHLLNVLYRVQNPLPLLLDRVGLARQPYVVRTWDGLACELRPHESDRYIFFEILVERLHLASGQSLATGARVVDIGANIGCFSILAGHLVGPTGRVIAVEPERSNYESLLRNINRNSVSNVTPRRLAVGATRGSAFLRLGLKASFSSILTRVDERYLKSEVQEVPMGTLEQIFDEANIDRCDLLKVDCEGGEYDIFLNLPPRVAKRIDQISLETHHVDGRHPDEIVSTLRRLDFRVRTDSGLVYAWRPQAAPARSAGFAAS